MGIFSSKNKSKVGNKPSSYCKIINYIVIDSINGKKLDEYYWEYGEKKKGLLAKKIELVFLEPGEYQVVAHGKTYQTKPTPVHIAVEANQNYVLGANEDGIYLMPYGSF